MRAGQKFHPRLPSSRRMRRKSVGQSDRSRQRLEPRPLGSRPSVPMGSSLEISTSLCTPRQRIEAVVKSMLCFTGDILICILSGILLSRRSMPGELTAWLLQRSGHRVYTKQIPTRLKALRMNVKISRRHKLCALLWAGDANKFVCSHMLKDDIEGVEGIDLAEEYYEGVVLVIDEMAAKGGRRLGALLNALAAKDND